MIGLENDSRLGIAVRARRHPRGWRLVDMADAAGVGASLCSLLERGRANRLTVRAVRAIAYAVDLPVEWDIGWRRQEVDRMLDSDRAALAARWTSKLERGGWVVRSEVSSTTTEIEGGSTCSPTTRSSGSSW